MAGLQPAACALRKVPPYLEKEPTGLGILDVVRRYAERMKSFLGQGSEVTLGAPKMRNTNLFVRLADLRARADLLR